MHKITQDEIHRYTQHYELDTEQVMEICAYEAFIRRAARVNMPFMLKGSLVTRQYLKHLQPIRYTGDIDWVCLTPVNQHAIRKILDDWMIAVTETELDDGVVFRSFSENCFWRMIDYALDDDFPTVNTDLFVWIDGVEHEFLLDVSLNMKLDLPPVSVSYQPLIGDTLSLPYVVSLEQQIAWKLHQTIIRPRFKDMLDITWLLNENTIDSQAVWQALLSESQRDKADVSLLKLLLDVTAPESPGFAYHPMFKLARKTPFGKPELPVSLEDSWENWYTNQANYFVNDVTFLPNNVSGMLQNLAEALHHSGLAQLINDYTVSPAQLKYTETQKLWWKIW